MFDLETWALVNLRNVRLRGVEIAAECPWCQRSDKFSIHSGKGTWNCYRNSCPSFGVRKTLASLISQVEGIGIGKALEMLPTKAATSKTKAVRIEPLKVDYPLPEEFIPCYEAGRDPEWRIVGYLQERGILRDVLKDFGVGFCRDGDYADRIIIPTICPNGRAFTARDATDRQYIRYKNPPGKWASLMIGGWQVYRPGQDIVLVEGPFDALKVASCNLGVAVLWLGGKVLSPEQRALLYSLSPQTHITIMIDPDERKYSVNKIANQLTAGFEHIYQARLVGDHEVKLDPGNADCKQIANALDFAERMV